MAKFADLFPRMIRGATLVTPDGWRVKLGSDTSATDPAGDDIIFYCPLGVGFGWLSPDDAALFMSRDDWEVIDG